MLAKYFNYSLYIIIILSILLPIGAYIAILAALALAILNNKGSLMRDRLLSDIPLLLIILCTIASTIFSKVIIFSILADILLGLQVAVVLLLSCTAEGWDIESCFTLLNITAIVVCILGLYQYFSGNMTVNKWWIDESTYGAIRRIYSTLYNPNIFASYLAINLCYSLSKLKNMKSDLLLAVNIALSSICLILTYSRGAFGAFFISLLVILFMKRDKWLIVYIILLAIVFYGANIGVHRADISTVGRDSSSLYRIEIWKSAINIFLQNMLTGNGVGTLWYFLASGSDKLSKYVLHAHNIYIQIACEMGIPGLLAFMYMIWDNVKKAFLYWQESKSFVGIGFISSIVGILTHGLIDAVILMPAMALIFACYFGLSKAVWDSKVKSCLPQAIMTQKSYVRFR